MDHEYKVTLTIRTKKRLTQTQQEILREEILSVVDDQANLPLDAEVVGADVCAK